MLEKTIDIPRIELEEHEYLVRFKDKTNVRCKAYYVKVNGDFLSFYSAKESIPTRIFNRDVIKYVELCKPKGDE